MDGKRREAFPKLNKDQTLISIPCAVMNRALVAFGVAALLAAGCGNEEESGGAAAEAREPPQADVQSVRDVRDDLAGKPAARRGPVVKLRQSQFGRVLFSGRDQAIYLFTRDQGRRSRCYGACAEAWPPFFTRGRPRAGKGVRQSLLGTTRRRNGRRQITYNGHPLYFYAHEGPRQILCQNVEEFGGIWLVVKRDGRPVR
jgi:predicted lipoprotein with Yx(FWY)xxD motif